MPISYLDHSAQQHASFLHGAGQAGTVQLLDMLRLDGTEQLLEIGCGTGASLLFLATNFPNLKLTGGDPAPVMYRKARQRIRFCGAAERVALAQIPAQPPYSWPAASFDVIWIESVLAIQATAVLEAIINECFRLLRPGGRLAFNETIWDKRTPKATIEEFNERCLVHFGIIQASGTYPYLEDWLALLHQQGFQVSTAPLVTSSYSTQQSYRNHRRSRLFDWVGKTTMRLSSNFRERQRQFKAAEHQLHAAGTAHLATHLFIAQKPNDEHVN